MRSMGCKDKGWWGQWRGGKQQWGAQQVTWGGEDPEEEEEAPFSKHHLTSPRTHSQKFTVCERRDARRGGGPQQTNLPLCSGKTEVMAFGADSRWALGRYNNNDYNISLSSLLLSSSPLIITPEKHTHTQHFFKHDDRKNYIQVLVPTLSHQATVV